MSVPLEIWGGIECSIVRVGQAVRNQLLATRYLDRSDDLQRIAATGIKVLRYPVLWEVVEAIKGARQWDRHDADLRFLREAGIRPIAGLVHHGSGPLWTRILDPEFPRHLAMHARAVAERYPWIEMFTPVNEPLTTARISGLYGLWYPHGTDEGTFFRLTVAQCLAIAAAMNAIRGGNPKAKLVQTEDFGRIFATPTLSYQAHYENERRWLALDLLTGRVHHGHPFFERLLEHGVERSLLDQLHAEPCSPDIIGIDHYLTSDRILDDRLELYPEEPVGGNGIEAYVDVAAVRTDLSAEMLCVLPRLLEVWERYRLPLAITEQHNGCTREEQLRWLIEGWRAAKTAREIGVDVRAVTCWAMLGAFDWNSMLVREDGYYESGAFDIRCSPPRRTVLAEALAALSQYGDFDHPALDRPGWWRSDNATHEHSRPLLLSGFGEMASILNQCCMFRRLRTVPLASSKAVPDAFREQRAWAIVRAEVPGRGSSRSMRLHAEYVAGGSLTLDVATGIEWRPAANAFLDLVVDHAKGELHLSHAADHNQYELQSGAVVRGSGETNDRVGA